MSSVIGINQNLGITLDMDIEIKMKFYQKTILGTLFFVLLANIVGAKDLWTYEFSLKNMDAEMGMNGPNALYVYPETKRYYVVDSGNNRLISFDETGTLINIFNANNQLEAPVDMARSQNGELFVIEKRKNSLTTINLKSHQITPVSLFSGIQEIYPHRLVQYKEELYLLDKKSGSVMRLGADSGVNTIFKCPDCVNGFIDFKIINDTLWAFAPMGQTLVQFSLDGKLTKKVSLQKQLEFPVSFAVDDSGTIYVLDRHAGSVNIYKATGAYIDSFLSLGHTQGKLYYPIELQFDFYGRLCIVDEGNARVEVYKKE